MKIQKIITSNKINNNCQIKTNTKKEDVTTQKYKSSLICLGNYNKAQISFGMRLNSDDTDISKLKLIPNFKIKPHSMFLFSRVMAHHRIQNDGIWQTRHSEDGTHCPWKMHLYADTEEDMQKLCTLMAPYLKKNDISWKTLGVGQKIDTALNQSSQKGKAITIYPHNNDEFARLAHDINFIIKNNNLEIKDTEIQGDKQLGDSGRIFYRYEYKSKQDKDVLIDINNDDDYNKYNEIYEPARENNNYLAEDMTPDDDIWLNFNPDIDGAKVDD